MDNSQLSKVLLGEFFDEIFEELTADGHPAEFIHELMKNMFIKPGMTRPGFFTEYFTRHFDEVVKDYLEKRYPKTWNTFKQQSCFGI